MFALIFEDHDYKNSKPFNHLNSFKTLFKFIFERERENVSRGGVERDGNTDLKQAPGSELSAQSLTQGSNS